jgi:hypothetical protein
MRMTFLQQFVQCRLDQPLSQHRRVTGRVAEEVTYGVIYLSDIVNANDSPCRLNAVQLPNTQPLSGMKWLF